MIRSKVTPLPSLLVFLGHFPVLFSGFIGFLHFLLKMCLFFSVFDVFSMVCLVCPCQTLRFVACLCSTYLTMMFSDLSFVVCSSDFALFCDSVLYLPAIMFSDLSNNVPSVSAGVSSPLSSFFSSLLLHSLEAIHDVSFNWFFPNKLG